MQIGDKWKKNILPGTGESLVNKVEEAIIQVDQKIHFDRLMDPHLIVTKAVLALYFLFIDLMTTGVLGTSSMPFFIPVGTVSIFPTISRPLVTLPNTA